MKNINRDVSMRFNTALDNAGMKAIDLAQRTGLSQGMISLYCHGRNTPSNKSAKKCADVLHVNPAWLMGFDVPMTDEVDTKIELDNDVALKAKEIYDDPEACVLLDAKRMLSPEELKAVVTIINSMIGAK